MNILFTISSILKCFFELTQAVIETISDLMKSILNNWNMCLTAIIYFFLFIILPVVVIGFFTNLDYNIILIKHTLNLY